MRALIVVEEQKPVRSSETDNLFQRDVGLSRHDLLVRVLFAVNDRLYVIL